MRPRRTPGGTIRVLGAILIALGILALIFRGFSYSRRSDSIRVGALSATVSKRDRIPIHPAIGAAIIVVGVGLVVVGSRRRS